MGGGRGSSGTEGNGSRSSGGEEELGEMKWTVDVTEESVNGPDIC